MVEPPNVWADYIDKRFRERAPKLVDKGNFEALEGEGISLPGLGYVGSAGTASTAVRREGRFSESVAKSCWDPDERLKAMAKDGVTGEVLYPTFALRMWTIPDPELQFACFQAYNNWLADFCRKHPKQLKGIGIVPHVDIEKAVLELHRIRDIGLAGGLLTIFPDEGRSYGDPSYDPIWAEAQGLDMPIGLHIGSERRPMVAYQTKLPINLFGAGTAYIQRELGGLVFGGVLERFPKLRVVSVENNAGWVPLWASTLDHIFDRRRNLHEWPLSRKMRPSEYVRRQVYFTFLADDDVWVPWRERIGVDRLMWSSDYPHLESSWPNSQAVIRDMFATIPTTEADLVLAGNAKAIYGF